MVSNGNAGGDSARVEAQQDRRAQVAAAGLNRVLETMSDALRSIDDSIQWLHNFERIQELQKQLAWPPISELDPKTYVPDFLKPALTRQFCENLLAHPRRKLIHEGNLQMIDSNQKHLEIYAFLFNDMLLLTKCKKGQPSKSKKVLPPVQTIQSTSKSQAAQQPHNSISGSSSPCAPGTSSRSACSSASNADLSAARLNPTGSVGALPTQTQVHQSPLVQGGQAHHGGNVVTTTLWQSLPAYGNNKYTVVRQPVPLDSCVFCDIGPHDAVATNVRNGFVIIHLTRFYQVVAVYTLQAPNKEQKDVWIQKFQESIENYESIQLKDMIKATPLISDERFKRVNSTRSELAQSKTQIKVNEATTSRHSFTTGDSLSPKSPKNGNIPQKRSLNQPPSECQSTLALDQHHLQCTCAQHSENVASRLSNMYPQRHVHCSGHDKISYANQPTIHLENENLPARRRARTNSPPDVVSYHYSIPDAQGRKNSDVVEIQL